MPKVKSEDMQDTTQNTTETATEATQPTYARDAADKVRAALIVLEAVQDFRYDGEHSFLREAMRQTALAALESAVSDAWEAWEVHQAQAHQAPS